MPLTPHHSRAFLLALSDFWTQYFQDRELLKGYAEGIALNTAQIYQRFLETVLGMSLEDAPLFSREFYRPYSVREDSITYEEGPSPDADLYVLPTGDGLVGAQFLTNRIILPTDALLELRDYIVRPGAIAFKSNPFDGLLTRFPSRTVSVVSPATWVDPLGRPWIGVQPGDTLRVRLGATYVDVRITGTSASTLFLSEAIPALRTSLSPNGGSAAVLRTPYDKNILGRLLSDHPLRCDRISPSTLDGATVPSSPEVDVSVASNYKGAWAPFTAYAEGEMVSQGGKTWQATVAHTSGLLFSDVSWDDLSTGFFYVTAPDGHRIDGLYGATTPSAGGLIALQRADFDTALGVILHRVTYAQEGAVPQIFLDHSHLTPGSAQINARRAVERVLVDEASIITRYPAFEAVQEGVDYLLDYETGALTILSAWDPEFLARGSYQWALEIVSRNYPWRGTYLSGVTYSVGDLLQRAGVQYVVRETHLSDGTFPANYFQTYVSNVGFDVPREVVEVSMWATDALLDEDTLYRNFGHQLGRHRPSSEAQRTFLKAISQLFLQGPSFGLLESALNALAGLPLVRESGEILLGWDNGVTEYGSTGRIYDQMIGNDGVLDSSTSRFSAATGQFQASDVGAEIRVAVGASAEIYLVTSVIDAQTVVVTPGPSADEVDLNWSAQHAAMRERLRISSASALRFTEAAVGGWVRLSGLEPRNQGIYRITSVDDPLTVALDTPYGFLDAGDVSWEFSPTGFQSITTTRHTYGVPLNVPVRSEIRDPANFGLLTFQAFSSLTEAFEVVDYLVDPSWWHQIQIPQELFDAPPAVRTVTPALIEHIYGAMDSARLGDPGLHYGTDDEGYESLARPCTATWYGGAHVVLAFDAEVPALRTRDVGQYLVFTTPPFSGSFRVQRVLPDGVTVLLENFPPREARRTLPPRALSAELPPLIFRHSVAYVLMDKLLKYHCLQIRMDPNVELPREVLGDMSRLIQSVKPSHTYVFIEAGTRFVDSIVVDEDIELAIERTLSEPILYVDTSAMYQATGRLRYGDAYRFVDRSASITPTPGVPVSLPTVLPAGTGVVRTLVKVGFVTTARVGARLPVEGVDFDVDYDTAELTLRSGVTITPSTVDVHYIDCIRRTIAPGDPLDPGETQVIYGGADPTIIRGVGQDPTTAGFLDRAVQLTFGP